MPFDPDEFPTMTIDVHFCQVCGLHPEEETEKDVFGPEDSGGRGKKGKKRPPKSHVVSYYVEAIALERCDECGMLACESCISEGDCCDRRAELETEGRPKAGQQEMFEGSTE